MSPQAIATALRDKDPSIAVVFDALDGEDAFIHGALDRVIKQSASIHRSHDEDLRLADRSQIKRLLANRNLNEEDRIAMCILLNRLKRSQWLKIKHSKYDVLTQVTILLLSLFPKARRIAKCSLRGHRCQKPDYCVLCAYVLRQKSAMEEYSGLVERASALGLVVYAVTNSYDFRPSRAGLHLVVEKRSGDKTSRDRLHHLYPFKDCHAEVRNPLVVEPDSDNLERIKACFEAPFRWMQNLTRSGVAVGWYGQRSIELGFVPHFWVLPHVHGLLVVPRSLSPSEAQDLYRRFVHTYDSAPYGRVLFPDLHLSPIETQQELNNWLVYILRPLDLAKPYKDAVRSGVDLGWLHEQIDDFTQGGDQVLRETTSPRKGGCLRVNGANYLGTGITNTTRRNDQKATTGEVTAAAAGSKNGQLASNCAWRESERRIRIAAVAFADDDE